MKLNFLEMIKGAGSVHKPTTVQWSPCSTKCGLGTKTRNVETKAKYGGNIVSDYLTKGCNLSIVQVSQKYYEVISFEYTI